MSVPAVRAHSAVSVMDACSARVEPVARAARAAALVLIAGLAAGCSDVADPQPEQQLPLPLPLPTGAYGVGTTVFQVVDADRDDGYTQDVPNDPRKLMVQVWYPTDAVSGSAAPYIDAAIGQLLRSFQDYVSPGRFDTIISALETNALVDAPMSAAGPFPVVFFSHGLGGTRALYTTFTEELASHGYVVVGIDHTYGAFAVEFPDGSLIFQRLTGGPPFRTVVEIWAEDMRSVLDELEVRHAADPDGLFTGALDLTRVGATGHSTGGSAAIQVHTMDARFTAASSLDAPQVGDAAENAGLDDPGLLFFANPSEYSETLVQDRMTGDGFTVVIDATTHYSFMDLQVIFELGDVPPAAGAASVRPVGAIDATTNLAIINGYTRQFFGRYLRGATAPLLDGAGGWSEATFAVVSTAAPVLVSRRP
jgi:dienelactone hydrolase